jgi:hypothetical protein
MTKLIILAAVLGTLAAPSHGADAPCTNAVAVNTGLDSNLQVEQMRAAANDPRTLEDKHFILWEYAGALRERELAKVVEQRASDPEVRALARLVRDGHQAGMDAMIPAATELNLCLPDRPTRHESGAIEALRALSPVDLERFFLRRQRAMHAWDITVFEDYTAAATSLNLKKYVVATRAPLREHAEIVDRVANKKGIAGRLRAAEGS